MKMQNLKEMSISVSDIKKEISEIVNEGETKIIFKNNVPMSVIMPYSDYITMNENKDEYNKRLTGLAQDITLSNGVKMMVCAEAEVGIGKVSADSIAIKTFIKMKTSGNYKLHYTLHLGEPNIEETLTTEEMREYYKNL